jgi:hypothetical protein
LTPGRSPPDPEEGMGPILLELAILNRGRLTLAPTETLAFTPALGLQLARTGTTALPLLATVDNREVVVVSVCRKTRPTLNEHFGSELLLAEKTDKWRFSGGFGKNGRRKK